MSKEETPVVPLENAISEHFKSYPGEIVFPKIDSEKRINHIQESAKTVKL